MRAMYVHQAAAKFLKLQRDAAARAEKEQAPTVDPLATKEHFAKIMSHPEGVAEVALAELMAEQMGTDAVKTMLRL